MDMKEYLPKKIMKSIKNQHKIDKKERIEIQFKLFRWIWKDNTQ